MPFESTSYVEVLMSLKRNISLGSGLSYRGGGPFLAYIMHRIGGSALFIFFTLYILSLLGMGFANTLFSNWLVQAILLVFGLWHVLNGLRITILDLFPRLFEHTRAFVNVVWIVYILLAGFALFVVLRSAFGG
jgi:succinate dehydrogenase/fumarate reductase cytochrome b subunit